ncbi:hypothetical protein DL767_008331 [Monosporascus sp. MG133]|nr:hypothetical protein DL767_008331 [Monosporascus sp. MG133]
MRADYIECTSDISTPTSFELQGLVDLYYGELEETQKKLADALSALNKAKQEVEQFRASARNDFAAVPEEDPDNVSKLDSPDAAVGRTDSRLPCRLGRASLYVEDGNVIGALCRAFGSVRTSAYAFPEEYGERDERRADELAVKICDCLSPFGQY